MALNSTPGPEDGPDGQVLAISGPHVVRDGWKWVQNDPWKFLLYHCVLKKCSKVHPWGSPWPCSSPWCSSEGHKSPDKIFGFSGLVYLPEHAESGHGHVSILVKPNFGLVAVWNILQMSPKFEVRQVFMIKIYCKVVLGPLNKFWLA